MRGHPLLKRLCLVGPDGGSAGAYPSQGFVALDEGQLGNGDLFGVYWPYGREREEPIVCETAHDGWALMHRFSGVPAFWAWLEANDFEWGSEEVDDPHGYAPQMAMAGALVRSQPDRAIAAYESIVEVFSDTSEPWFRLASQRRRLEDARGAVQAAVQSFTSNWAFGMPNPGVLRMLRAGKDVLPDDPLVQASDRIELQFGGTKENETYAILDRIIDAYLDSSTPLRGLLLHQNLGYLMTMETGAFRERHDFDVDEWRETHTDLCVEFLDDSRERVS